MLREVHISNLAVIADARIELRPGLNCFTGATGAGKSLVIGAIEVLLGMRSPAEMLRRGADEGRVSGVFELKDKQTIAALERAIDVPLGSDAGELLLTRRLFSSGRTSATVNGHPITLTMLRGVAESLVDVHGQHDHQHLLKPSNQLDVIDQFGNLLSPRAEYRAVFAELQDIRARLQALSTGQSLRQQQLDLYRFQAEEIDAAELQPGEYEELKARSAVLTNLGKLKSDASAAYAALYESDGATLERLKMTAAVLAELAGIDASLRPVADSVRDATLRLEDASFDLGRYLNRLELDPAELAEVNDRLDTIHRLLSKYGDRVEDVLRYREQLGTQLAQLGQAGEDLSSLTKQIDPLSKQVAALSADLSRKRKSAAAKLAPLIEKQFAELGMDRATFTIAFESTEPTASGTDAVEFVARTNPGLAPAPLRKIASGGELSRIMLALKSVLAQGDRVSVLVFDEIDANVGGRLGSIIGEKLRAIAKHHQVLCITHLPQIAGFADRHLTVRKSVADDVTSTVVRAVDGADRVEELAEMIGGQKITETTRAQARELLATAGAGDALTIAPKRRRVTRAS